MNTDVFQFQAQKSWSSTDLSEKLFPRLKLLVGNHIGCMNIQVDALRTDVIRELWEI